jgi:hypothetical protein
MELYLATLMDPFLPQTGSIEDWNAAYYRLHDYFRAHSIRHKIHESQIILQLLERAAVKHAQDPTQDPTRLALEEAYAEIENWFRRVLPANDLPSHRLSNTGRVSMYIVEATTRWPNVFLSPEPPPADFSAAMQAASVQSGPDLNISSMVPRPLDVAPVAELLEETWQKLGRVSFGLLAVMAFACAGGIFLLTR